MPYTNRGPQFSVAKLHIGRLRLNGRSTLRNVSFPPRIDLAFLEKEVQHNQRVLDPACPARLPDDTLLYLRAIDWRMNSQSILCSIPMEDRSKNPAEPFSIDAHFSSWLSENAPGLRDAAAACSWDDLGMRTTLATTPNLQPLTAEEFLKQLRWFLYDSLNFYAHRIEAAPEVLERFLASEFQHQLQDYSFFRVDVASVRECIVYALPPDFVTLSGSYFDNFGNDSCHLWYNEHSCKVLLTNGSD